ncbi:hypothetical protein BIT28_11665 [Photobacterium proteolyticum]|uniref:Uncharacterized protein n=1 Tax=Photobacterium proteolyticum TaxID=1903952 RepID=A0A1Q9GD67_9GAMM|nr:hypothetical protein BIT28_11665 [Photobacterium proteolyticum]
MLAVDEPENVIVFSALYLIEAMRSMLPNPFVKVIRNGVDGRLYHRHNTTYQEITGKKVCDAKGNCKMDNGKAQGLFHDGFLSLDIVIIANNYQ